MKTGTPQASLVAPTPKIAVAKPASSPRPRVPSPDRVFHAPAPNPAPNLLDGEDLGADPGTLPTDQVFDETDQAQWMQLREQADILRRGREMNLPEQHPDFDGKHCVDCDDEIPSLRLAMHRVRCVDCQQALEDDRNRQRRTGG